MPVFFSPTKELIKSDTTQEELKEKDPSYTPFIQIRLEQSEITAPGLYIKKFRGMQVQIQEMKINVETGFVNAMLKFQY